MDLYSYGTHQINISYGLIIANTLTKPNSVLRALQIPCLIFTTTLGELLLLAEETEAQR